VYSKIEGKTFNTNCRSVDICALIYFIKKKQVNQSHYKPGQTLKVPGG
jgi:hypothetical protein